MTTDQLLAAIAGAMGVALCVVIAWAIKSPAKVAQRRGNRPPWPLPKPSPVVKIDEDSFHWDPTVGPGHPNQPVRDCIAAIRREQGLDMPSGFRFEESINSEMLRTLELVEKWMDAGQPWPHSDACVLDEVSRVIKRARG